MPPPVGEGIAQDVDGGQHHGGGQVASQQAVGGPHGVDEGGAWRGRMRQDEAGRT